jgi:pyruvate dehydrogenase E2 component (dihydrolipoamide acetyltransferase)
MPDKENEAHPAKDVGAGVKKSVRIRRLIERKMVDSWQHKPHFYVTIAVDMTDIIRFRKDLGITINDFIMAATSAALNEHPWVNSHWVDGEAIEQAEVNLAMAVATEGGLYYPVIKNVGQLSLKQLGQSAAVLAEKAHLGQLTDDDQEGGTFTVTNMGMLGVESFAAIVTPPQAAVLAVGTVKGEVVVDEHEELVVAPMVRVTLSADHRILDGADAAEFLDSLKSYLEAPVTLIAGTSFDEA